MLVLYHSSLFLSKSPPNPAISALSVSRPLSPPFSPALHPFCPPLSLKNYRPPALLEFLKETGGPLNLWIIRALSWFYSV